MRMELDESGRCPPSYSQAVHRLPPATVQRTVSGSETDVSTSTENLTREEKYVLNHTERQEPQGEENFVTPSPVSSLSLSTPPAVMEWAKSVDGFKCPAPVSSRPLSGRPPPKYQLPAAAAASVSAASAGGDSAAAAAAGGVVYQRRPALLHTPELALASRPATSVSMVPGALSQSLIMSQSSAAAAPSPAVAAAAAASVATPSVAHRSGASMAPAPAPAPAAMVISGGGGGQPAVDPAAGAAGAAGVECRLTPNVTEMIQLLMQENAGLKQHLAAYQRKVQKMQQFAEELSQLQAAYDDLVHTCQRREQLEGLARQRLAAEARRANQLNTSLSCQLADTSTAAAGAPTAAAAAATSCSGSCESERRQLAALNRELLSTKERQEIELAAQRSTLQEQRQYIDILDTALTKAQENTALIERQHAERIRCQYVERSTYVERVAQLQRQLTASQLAAERRETAHRKIRAQLERELAELRCSRRDTLLLLQESSGDGAGGGGGASGGGGEEVHARETELASLRQQLRTAHERILLMENELAHAHQKFVDGGESEAELLLNASVAHRSIASPPPPLPPSTAAAAALRRSTALASEAYCAQLVDASATQMAPAAEATSSSSNYCRSQFSQSAAAPPTVQQQQQQQYLSAVCQPLSLADQRDQSIEHRMMSLEVQLAEKEALVRELQQRRHRTTLRTPASVAATGGAGGGAGSVAPQPQPPPHGRQSSAQSLPATASYATSSAVLSDMLAPSCSSLIHSSHRGAGGRSLLDETLAHDYASVTPSVLSTLSAELDRLSTNQRRSPSSLANQRPPASAVTNPGTPAASALANRSALSSMAANQSAAQPAAYVNTCHILPPYLSSADRLTASPHSQHQQPYDSGRADFPPLTSANHSAVLSALANQSAAHAASTNHNPPYNVSASHSAADTYSTNHNPPVYSGSTNQSAVYAASTNHNPPYSVSANQTLSPLVTSSSPPPHPSTANSILLALQKDTEVFPDHYWQV